MNKIKIIDRVTNYLDQHRKSIKIVSFDVFDTLVLRKIAPPDLVKVPSARIVSEILGDYGKTAKPSECLKKRTQIENHLKRKKPDVKETNIFHIKNIIRNWFYSYLTEKIREEHIRRVHAAEMKAELSVCYPNPEIHALLDALHDKGLQIIFVSDMYLALEDIRSILQSCRLDDYFDKGFVSSDVGLTKHSGLLFRHILNALSLEASQIVHIGDNLTADYLKPRELGIHSFVYTDPEYHKWIHHHHKLWHLSQKKPFWEGARWCEMTPPDSAARKKSVRDLPYAIGYWVLGPLFTTFTHEVLRRIISEDIQTVVFPAREGFLLRQLYEILAKAEIGPKAPQANYIFLSRRSTFLASAPRIGMRELTRGYEKSTSMRIILNKLNLDANLIEPLIDNFCYYRMDDIIDQPVKDTRLQEFIRHPKFIAFYNTERKRQRQLLTDYLDQFGFWQETRAAIVDVGWSGTIQESLALAFKDSDKMPALHGYYMALLDRASVPVQETAKNRLHGIFFDYRTDTDPAIVDRFTELLENAARAPHASTIGYRRSADGTVLPVLKPEDDAKNMHIPEDAALVASLQTGILEYAEAYINWLPFQLSNPVASQSFHLAQWERITRYPFRHEVKLLRQILHTNEFIGNNPRADDLSQPRNYVLQFYGALKKGVIWPEGFYTSLRIPGANLMFNLYRLLCKQYF